MSQLLLFNRQKTLKLNMRLLRQICRAALEERTNVAVRRRSNHPSNETYEIGIHLVDTAEMTRLNEDFLKHPGTTDVITFDYREDAPSGCLSGEIFISIDEAVAQARRFGAAWQSELIRYVVHGLLHLRGYDDSKPEPRKIMKRQENRLLKGLSRRFVLGKLTPGKHASPAK